MDAFELGDAMRLYRSGLLDEEDMEELWQLAPEEAHFVFVKVACTLAYVLLICSHSSLCVANVFTLLMCC